MDHLKDENFFYNSMLSKAIIQLIPGHERRSIEIWIDRLFDLNETQKEREIRNDYMWFILMMLQTQKLKKPFLDYPPSIIRPLREFLDDEVYESVMYDNLDNKNWSKPSDKVAVKEPRKSTHPSKFLSNQPIPMEGVICYMATFGANNRF